MCIAHALIGSEGILSKKKKINLANDMNYFMEGGLVLQSPWDGMRSRCSKLQAYSFTNIDLACMFEK